MYVIIVLDNPTQWRCLMLKKVALDDFRAGQLYKATGNGFFSAEPFATTKQFFAKTDLMHVVMLTSNQEHGYILFAFAQLMTVVAREHSMGELRFTYWSNRYWSITSLPHYDVPHLEEVALDYSHTISRLCYVDQNKYGVIEDFPFAGKYFRSLNPL